MKLISDFVVFVPKDSGTGGNVFLSSGAVNPYMIINVRTDANIIAVI